MGRQKHKFDYIDLFAGIGGFHQAMDSLGGKCVFASEIDEKCRNIYSMNFPKTPIKGDIRECNPQDVGDYSVVCAGFPCQPFSKAGKQYGFKDEKSGNLFFEMLRFIKNPNVKFIILENVRNLADKDDNWRIIQDKLNELDFCITRDPLIISPTFYNIPQLRQRVYILGIRNSCKDETKLKNASYVSREDLGFDSNFFTCKCNNKDAFSICQKKVLNKYVISDELREVIDAWDNFREGIHITTLGFPVWISCFGAGIDNDDVFHRKIGYEKMKDWKKRFVDHNRELYLSNRQFIDDWLIRYNMQARIKIHQKFEWNCGTDCEGAKDALIQFRQSGVRFKRPDYYPSLVAMTSNVPVIWDKTKNMYRYLTPREESRLQSFKPEYKLTGTDSTLYHQFGNSVNVCVIKDLAERLFRLERGKDR